MKKTVISLLDELFGVNSIVNPRSDAVQSDFVDSVPGSGV